MVNKKGQIMTNNQPKPLLTYTWQEEEELMNNRRKRNNIIKWFILLFVLLALGLLLTSCARADMVDIGIISKIESSGNPTAFNSHSGAIGLCQITSVALKEYNVKNKTHIHRLDLFNGKTNLMVANWYINNQIPIYLRHYKLEDTTKNRLWAYNAGIGMVKKGILPKETRNYIIKYNRLNKGA